ncbi:MAG: hypothetical protein V1740_03170 [Candidatus Woesearchaeota archaeon]
MIKKYTTNARPSPKNEVWEQVIDGKKFICERPYYFNKKLEVELFAKGFENESKLIFGEKLPFFFDKEGRWWADPKLCSQELMNTLINDPIIYFKTISRKVNTVKKIIPQLKQIEKELETEDPENLLKHFKMLTRCFVDFFSYHFITYIVSDEIVLKFNNVLHSFLDKQKANVYFSEFLRAEITKEALKVGAIGESTVMSRDIYYSESKPIVFYKTPKILFSSQYDNEIIENLYEINPSAELLQEFFSLRLITPIVIQINEEAQYIESKMLLPMFKINLEKIKELFVKNEFIERNNDIRNLSKEEIESQLKRIINGGNKDDTRKNCSI